MTAPSQLNQYDIIKKQEYSSLFLKASKSMVVINSGICDIKYKSPFEKIILLIIFFRFIAWAK